MAEGDAPPIKRRKTFPQISPTKYVPVLNATKHLENDFESCLVMLKIEVSNAYKSANFSSRCLMEFVRSIDANDDQASGQNCELYFFSDIFVDGVEIIRNFVQDGKVPEGEVECIALERLISVINRQEDIARKLRDFQQSNKKNQTETLWSIELVHHLLKELAVNQSYVIDRCSKNKVEKCLCGEQITGQYGDCSIGSPEVWHGRLDILLGSQDVALAVVTESEEREERAESAEVTESEEREERAESSKSSDEIKYEDSLKNHYSQILAEAIVFAFVQKKYNPHLENFLIPTIGIDKKYLSIFFYDAVHDILLESSEFSLLHCYGTQHDIPMLCIPYTTIFALWLTINYRYFCTGITTSMKKRGFTADFFKNVPEAKKGIYLEGLKLGGVSAKGSTYPDKSLCNLIGGPLFAQKSEPYGRSRHKQSI